jgi:arsenate reductase
MALFAKIETTLNQQLGKPLATNRRIILENIAQHLQTNLDLKQALRLNFICTHNSRRSHLAQVWAQALAHHYQIPQFHAYSGGTQKTALYPATATALAQSGFEITDLSQGANPIYALRYAANEPAVVGFSKTVNHPFNPTTHFTAIMTCHSADEACPVVLGAEARFALPYTDPKMYDNSDQQLEQYLASSLEIANELNWLFQQLKA